MPGAKTLDTYVQSITLGIYIAVLCAGSTGFINESLVLLPETSDTTLGPSISLKLDRDITLILVYRLIVDVQYI